MWSSLDWPIDRGWLSPSTLEAVVTDYGIRSIISLVPPAPDEYWYRAERRLSAAREIIHYEMPLSAENELTSDQLHQLLLLLQSAPKPLLIQSRSGADRSGLAAAIFKYAVASRSVEEAKGQLSIRYRHVPYLWTGTGAMDASFQRFLREGRAQAATS
jgi:protein tyrosine/serine phosphatase